MARKTDVAVLSEKKVLPPHQRPCDYCGEPSEGAVNGRSACGRHFTHALDGARPMQDVKVRS